MDLKYKNGVATLTINEVFPEDEGVYTCLGKNVVEAKGFKLAFDIDRHFVVVYSTYRRPEIIKICFPATNSIGSTETSSKLTIQREY